MTDDIVTRLREVACDNRSCGNDPYCRLCDAADEIERLRKENLRLHRELDMEIFGESEIKESDVE
jgi:hypothetical protein